MSATIQLLAVLSGCGIYAAGIWLYGEPPKWRQYIFGAGLCLLLLSLVLFGSVYIYCWSRTELFISSAFTCNFSDAITFQNLGRVRPVVRAFGAIAFFVGGVLLVIHGLTVRIRSRYGANNVS